MDHAKHAPGVLFLLVGLVPPRRLQLQHQSRGLLVEGLLEHAQGHLEQLMKRALVGLNGLSRIKDPRLRCAAKRNPA